MKHSLPLFLLTLLLAIMSCDDRPATVLSRGKMEDVLYDYHLMQGLIDRIPYNERADKAQDYINAVYEKHHITEAQFDSSIIYYNRHTKDLHKIYANLKERYTAANEEIQLINGNNDMMAIFTTGGDTTNLWNSTPLLVLRNKPLLNKESFTIHADTSFRQHDQFILTLTPVFLHDTKENNDFSLNVGLSILYKNGKHIGTTRYITNNSIQQLTLQGNATENIKSITGFFYYKGKTNTRNLCLIDAISLVRMHEKEPKSSAPTDSVIIDSITVDTIPQPAKRRFTPDEIRHMNKQDKHIKIESAPAVRTPNSIGPRRRTNTPQQHRP